MDWHTPSPDVPPHLLKEWRAEEQAIRIYEDPGCFGLSLSSSEELTTTEPESWERQLDWLESFTDESSFDETGRVW